MRIIGAALLFAGILIFALLALLSLLGGKTGPGIFYGLLATGCAVGWVGQCVEDGVSPGKTILLTLLACIGLGFLMGGDD